MNIFTRKNWLKRDPQTYSLSTTKDERDEFCASIINSSSPSFGFYLLLFLSTFIVSIGLMKNNVVLLIGGMLVAPLLSPILSISLSLTILNFKVFIRSFLVVAFSAFSSMLLATIIGLFTEFDLNSLEFVYVMKQFDITSFLIPVAAGAAASFTWAKKDLISSLSGVAVTVTLMPPLAAMGLALSLQDFAVFKEALAIYGANVFGIIIGSLAIFLMLGFYKSSKKLIQEVQREENA